MFVTTPNPPTPPPSLPSGAHLRLSILDQINGMPAVMNLKWSTWSSQQERRLAGWLSCWRCSSGGIAKWNSVFRFSPFVIRRSSRTWTRPRLKFSAPASVRGRLVHDCRLSDVEWRRKGKKSLNGKWLQTSIPVQLVVSCDWPLGTQNWAMGSGCGLDGIRWRTWLYPLGTHSIPFLSSSLFAGTGGKQIKGGYLLRYKSEYLLT